MTYDNKTVRLAAGLIEQRDSLRSLKGDRYDAFVEPCRKALRQLKAKTGDSAIVLALPAVASAESEGQTGAAWQIMAAAVDVDEEAP